jgi:hypothetical protein
MFTGRASRYARHMFVPDLSQRAMRCRYWPRQKCIAHFMDMADVPDRIALHNVLDPWVSPQ